jgi:hypothetical protein
MAVKRGKPEPLLEDVSLCARMGWTLNQLRRQPARFVEVLGVYLGALDDMQSRENRRLTEEFESKMRRLRP